MDTNVTGYRNKNTLRSDPATRKYESISVDSPQNSFAYLLSFFSSHAICFSSLRSRANCSGEIFMLSLTFPIGGILLQNFQTIFHRFVLSLEVTTLIFNFVYCATTIVYSLQTSTFILL